MLHDAADRDVSVFVAEGVDVDLVGAVEVLFFLLVEEKRKKREEKK